MVSTTTERGITNKNILFGLRSGYVFALPKMFLDPRREFKQTKMLQEEGVPPYMPELPVHPQAFINYNKTGLCHFTSAKYCAIFLYQDPFK